MKKPLIIWGGVDVNPERYNETPLKYTQTPNNGRDAEEFYMVGSAIEKEVPVIGVCRGAQLLCVFNGGKLIQHSRPEEQCHSIMTNDDNLFQGVLAGHHQIMMPRGEHQILAWNPGYTRVWWTDEESEHIKNLPEVVWFPKTKCLAIQPHPEWDKKDSPWVKWLNNLLKEKGIDYAF